MTEQLGVPLSQVIGDNCRRIRLREGRTQGDVAAACVRVGLGWGYRRVAQLEAGGVAPTVPTLLRLTAALDSLGVEPVTLADLLWSECPVRLSDDDAADEEVIPGTLLVSMLTWGRGQDLLPHLRPFPVEEKETTRKERARSDYGRADERAAKELGLRRPEMIAITHSLWGHGLETERERRAAESDIGHNRAARAWITTTLRDELRAELERQRNTTARESGH